MELEATDRALEAFRRRPRPLRLECGVQHYGWGDPDAIPALLDIPNPERRPFAELWAGAHPDLPSVALIDGMRVALDELVRAAPLQVLGAAVEERFGPRLPFLIKVLAAARPLSLQAHPDAVQARAGFERENRAGIPLDAPERSYRDPGHKPELLVAISDFHALVGFRPPDEIRDELARTPELASLAGRSPGQEAEVADLCARVLRMEQERVEALLDPLLTRLRAEDRHAPFPPESREHWVLRADQALSSPGRRERGLLSFFLLNLVRLRPGEAIYLPPGELHTYLLGVGVEVMAESNNVLRGGLTSKHVDVEELLRILSFRAAPAPVVAAAAEPRRPGLTRYPTPAAEFALARLDLVAGRDWAAGHPGPQIALVTEGALACRGAGPEPLRIRSGEALLIPAGCDCRLETAGNAVVWLVGLPL